MRVYIPGRESDLAALVEDGYLGLTHAHAVTDALRAAWPDAAEDEREYAALMAAADECVPAGATSVRRVVLAADVDAATSDPERGESAVLLSTPVQVRQLAAVHADPDPVAPDSDDDLAWYAVQEIPDLL